MEPEPLQSESAVFDLLQGIRVLDFTQYLSGPLCTAILAGLGAEVVKVEPPKGDGNRGQPPFVREGGLATSQSYSDGFGLAFWKRNCGKRSVSIDLKHPDGRELAEKLIAKADVVVENFRPGVADRLGIGWTRVREINPDAVYCDINGYGKYRMPGDSDAAAGATDIVIQALSGLMAFTGFDDTPPTRVGIPIADQVTGLYAAIGVLAALCKRGIAGTDDRGGGRRVEVSMLSALSALVWDEPHDVYCATGASQRRGNTTERLAPFSVYRSCDNKYVAIGAASNQEWRKLADALGMDDLGSRPDLSSVEGRVRARSELDRRVSAWAGERTREEVVRALAPKGVTVAPVYGIGDILQDRSFREEVLIDIEDGRFGRVGAVQARFPLQFGGVRLGQIGHGAPLLGEHSRVIAAGLAGLDDDEIEYAIRHGVLHSPENRTSQGSDRSA